MVLRLRPSFVCLFAAFATALPAQGGKPKPDKGPDKTKVEKPKAEKNDKGGKGTKGDQPPDAPKDDAVTAKDAAIVAIDKFRKLKVSTARADWKTALPAPPPLPFEAGHEYRWVLQTTKGRLVVKLLADAAPVHVGSVIHLARCGFYDGLTFPRVVKGFMAQGGSPSNTTGGNAGYALDLECKPDVKHDVVGTLSAANSGQPHTDGSQFFLTFGPQPGLDGKYSVHGRVIEGLDVLKAIEAAGAEVDGQPPAELVTIQRSWITVVEKAAAPAEPARGPGK